MGDDGDRLGGGQGAARRLHFVRPSAVCRAQLADTVTTRRLSVDAVRARRAVEGGPSWSTAARTIANLGFGGSPAVAHHGLKRRAQARLDVRISPRGPRSGLGRGDQVKPWTACTSCPTPVNRQGLFRQDRDHRGPLHGRRVGSASSTLAGDALGHARLTGLCLYSATLWALARQLRVVSSRTGWLPPGVPAVPCTSSVESSAGRPRPVLRTPRSSR